MLFHQINIHQVITINETYIVTSGKFKSCVARDCQTFIFDFQSSEYGYLALHTRVKYLQFHQ